MFPQVSAHVSAKFPRSFRKVSAHVSAKFPHMFPQVSAHVSAHVSASFRTCFVSPSWRPAAETWRSWFQNWWKLALERAKDRGKQALFKGPKSVEKRVSEGPNFVEKRVSKGPKLVENKLMDVENLCAGG